MKKKNYLFFIMIASFLLFSIHDLNSESLQKKKNQESEEHKVTVTLKLVQVYVTDKKGNPIMDLKKEDFELFDNGKLKEITEFEKHILSMPSIKPKPEQAPLPKLNRKFFLFFDFFFNTVDGIHKMKEAALHFIDNQLQPTDEIAILTYSMLEGLSLQEYLTTDHLKVREVIEGSGVRNYLGRDEVLDVQGRGFLEEDVKQEQETQAGKTLSAMNRRFIETYVRDEIKMYKHHVLDYIKCIKDLAKGLSYIEGSKHLLLFSAGIMGRIFTGRVQFDQSDFGDALLREMYEEMGRELASSDCFVHTLDTEGPKGYRSPNVTRQDLGADSLQRLSELTGGKPFGNIEFYERDLKEIQNMTGSYYVLGYYISEKWDGRYNKIKVKVKRKACEVRTQGGYFNPKLFKKLSKLEKELHLTDLAVSEVPQSKVDLSFLLIALPCMIDEKTGLVMISKIPVKGIQEIAGKKVEIANFIFDEKDSAVDKKRWEVDFSIFPKKNIYYYSLSSLTPGRYKYRIVVRNLKTGKSAVSSSLFIIPEKPDSGLKLDPPLLLVAERDTFYLKGATIEKKDKAAKSITLTSIYPYDLSQFTPLVGELSQGTSSFFAVLPCSVNGIQQPEIKLFGRIIHKSTGKEYPINFTIMNTHKDRGRQIFYLRLRIDILSPGKYVVDFLAKEMKSRSESKASTTIIIR